MPCSPLAVGVGLFINTAVSDSWSAAPSSSVGGKTVTLTATGPDPGISVTGPNGTLFHQTLGTDISRYLFFGSSNYLLLLEAGTGPSAVQYTVSLIDFTSAPIHEVMFPAVLADNSSVSFPTVQYSQGTGSAFLLLSTTGTEWTAAIYRSDNGQLLNSGPGPFIPTGGQTEGEATVTQSIVHYSAGGVSSQFAQALPSGTLTITPPTATFPDRVIGGCPTPPPTLQVTLRNSGNDCLIVDSVGSAGPFSVAATSQPLPAALPAGQQMTATISFAPTSVGVFGPTSLPVVSTPAVGANKLVCAGTGRDPVAGITVSPNPIQFGDVPVGSAAAPRTLTVTNSGEQPLQVSVAPSPAGSPFSWAGDSVTMTCAESIQISLGFTPVTAGPAAAELTVANDAPTGTVSVQVDGTGILVSQASWTPASLDFGTVSLGDVAGGNILVTNTGAGDLIVSNITCSQGFTTDNVESFTVTAGQDYGLPVLLYSTEVSLETNSGNLTFNTNDPDHPAVDIPLSYILGLPSGCLSSSLGAARRLARMAGALYRRSSPDHL